MGEERELQTLSCYKGTNPVLEASPSWPHLNLIIAQTPPPNMITLGVGFNVCILGRHLHSAHNINNDKIMLMLNT